jgi:oligoendopeptidase F
MELRRKNPDTLDKLKFSMSDKKYGKLLALLAKGALIAAAVYAYPYVWGPLFAVGFYAKSRQKNIERRDQGLKPRWYHDIRPDDKY